MAEGETPTVEELQRENRTLREQIREVNAEARDHRLERNEARKQLKELEAQFGELKKGAGGGPESAERIKALEAENRRLKHRGVFDRVAREAGARTAGKALDALWDALEYEADGDADPEDIAAKIEAARADYDFLFQAAPAGGETPEPAPKKPAAPPARPGPGGTGRGAPADGAGTVRVRRSDLQSFDPRVNPMMDRARAAQVEAARKAGKLEYIDE